MKTHKNLFSTITPFHNLLLAVKNAEKGKRFKPTVAPFLFHQERELARLQTELSDKTYLPSAYRTFTIIDPKERRISAAPFRDRVVHHALCNVIEPVFEKTFIRDSFANRKKKGTHKAIECNQQFAKLFPCV